jgi:hypothetical protein
MRRLKTRFHPLFFLLAGLSVLPGPAWAQDAAELLRRAAAAQSERLAGVENLTIVQEVMGAEMTMYLEKREAGGVPVLMPVSVKIGGVNNPIPQDMAQADWSNPVQEEWIDRTRLVGTDEVDGTSVYVFRMEDFTGLELPGLPSGSEGPQDFYPLFIEYSLGQEDFQPRQVVMEGEALKPDGSRAPVKTVMFMEDFREVDGYSHPFKTRAVTEGLVEAADVDREEIRAQLAEMRSQLENIPEAQRAMMEGMLNAQMEQLESMLGGEGGMEMLITVKSMRVNAGPPGGGR